MTIIEWDESFSIGVDAVDHEHRELIGLVNDAHDRLMSTGGTGEAVNFLGEIYARISAHFALEEQIMRMKNYDRYDEHKADHERLLDDIRDIMDDCEDEALFDQPQFAQRLRVWFTGHFSTHDARLHRRLD